MKKLFEKIIPIREIYLIADNLSKFLLNPEKNSKFCF